MPDNRIKGIEAAQVNSIKHRRTVHPWHVQDNATCLAIGCTSRVYFDGQIYFSLCLACLQEKQLGPFRPRIPPVDYS